MHDVYQTILKETDGHVKRNKQKRLILTADSFLFYIKGGL